MSFVHLQRMENAEYGHLTVPYISLGNMPFLGNFKTNPLNSTQFPKNAPLNLELN